MIYFFGRSNNAQSQTYDCRLLSGPRVHSGSCVPTIIQDDDHGERASCDARRHYEMRFPAAPARL
jgi:hypothetical protein